MSDHEGRVAVAGGGAAGPARNGERTGDGILLSEIMQGFQPARFVIEFLAESTHVGHGAL